MNEDGDKPRWIRLERCRVIENAGSLTKENSTWRIVITKHSLLHHLETGSSLWGAFQLQEHTHFIHKEIGYGGFSELSGMTLRIKGGETD